MLNVSILYCLNSSSRHFQPGKGPSRARRFVSSSIVVTPGAGLLLQERVRGVRRAGPPQQRALHGLRAPAGRARRRAPAAHRRHRRRHLPRPHPGGRHRLQAGQQPPHRRGLGRHCRQYYYSSDVYDIYSIFKDTPNRRQSILYVSLFFMNFLTIKYGIDSHSNKKVVFSRCNCIR